MFDDGSAGLTYAVVTDELVRAASAVLQVTESAKAATIETLPQAVTAAGHGRLQVTLRDFCARWDTGLSHLVGDSETMSQRLGSCAQNYLENEDQAQGAYQQLTSCTPMTPPPQAPRLITADPGQQWVNLPGPGGQG